MTVDLEYMDYAAEYIRLAGLTNDLEVRDQLVELASQWMADARDKCCGQARRLVTDLLLEKMRIEEAWQDGRSTRVGPLMSLRAILD